MPPKPKKKGSKVPNPKKKKPKKNLTAEQEKARSDRYKERKEHNNSRSFTTIKTGYNKLCRDQEMSDVLEDCVHRCSVIAIEASMLASLHLLRLLESNFPLPEVLDDTFFNNCVSRIANLKNKTKHANDVELYETLYEHYLPLKPHGYVDVGRVQNVMSQMLVIIAQQARLNFVVSTEMTIIARLKRWLRLQIKLHKVEGDYFSVYGGQVEKSIVKMMLRSCLDHAVEVRNIMNQYKVIRDQHPIPEADIIWMQNLCNGVRISLVELPLAVSQQPQTYLPFLFKMLRDLEADNDKEFRLFSLLPQKKVRPLNITINNTILKELHKYLSQDRVINFAEFEGDHGTDLWNYYFNINPIVKRNKRFEKEIVTDCMSASLLVSREKRNQNIITPQNARQAARDAFTYADRVVAVDPGRNPIISAVVHNDNALLDIMDEYNTHHETLVWGKKEHYHECGFRRRTIMTNLWMGRSEVITNYNTSSTPMR